MKPVTQSKPAATEQQVQLALFSRGDAISNRFVEALNVVPRYKKDKKKKVMKDANGKEIIVSETMRLLPKKSEEGNSLEKVTGLTGQALMTFEVEARKALLQSAFSDLAQRIASGNYTYDVARHSLNGKVMLQIKPAVGKSPLLSTEQLKEQSAAMGYKLVPIDPAPETPTEPESKEATLDTSKKGKRAAAKAKPAQHKPAIVSQPATQ